MKFSDESYNLLVDLDMKHCKLRAGALTKMEASLSPLGDMVRHFPVSKLHVVVTYRDRTNDYSVRTSLILSGDTLVASEHHEQVHAAFEHCIDNLVREVRRYKDRLGNVAEQAKQQEGTHHDLLPTLPPDPEAVESAVAAGDYAAFRAAVSGYDTPVATQVGRWVERYPEVASRLGHGLQIGDIVEDVFLCAFEDYEHRSHGVRFGDWLGRYIDTAIKSIAAHPDQELENINMARLARELETGRGAG
ncbi:MAG TPA: HPF/RaiA family ribosome-associated protein [Gemmataceae bacterium]|jgi:ribosome-associated translation inhibitor RaiA